MNSRYRQNVLKLSLCPTQFYALYAFFDTDQENIAGHSGNQSEIGDVPQSLFFSPQEATQSGWICVDYHV
jgi:hypothetical protein